MENPGEHIVGQYLQLVKGCDFVQYNLQTKKTQGEIDVVAINSNERKIYVCEVATHLETGLQYTRDNQPDNVNRLVSKFEKDINYTKENFKDYEQHYMLWVPIVKTPKNQNAKNNQTKDIEDIKQYLKVQKNIILEVVCNEVFLGAIGELRKIAKETTQEMKSPIMRFLQIEEKIKKSIVS